MRRAIVTLSMIGWICAIQSIWEGSVSMMPNAVWMISYQLVKGASVPDFLIAQEKCNSEVLSRKKGFISWKALVNGDTWADLVTWETMEDAQNAENGEKDGGSPHPAALRFYSFIDFATIQNQVYAVERSYPV